jgi:hypothetical protein
MPLLRHAVRQVPEVASRGSVELVARFLLRGEVVRVLGRPGREPQRLPEEAPVSLECPPRKLRKCVA